MPRRRQRVVATATRGRRSRASFTGASFGWVGVRSGTFSRRWWKKCKNTNTTVATTRKERDGEEEETIPPMFFCDDSDVRDQTRVTCATTSPCGKYIAAGSRVNVATNVAVVRLWEVAGEGRRRIKKQSESLVKLSLHKGEVTSLAFSPCSKFIASLGGASDNYQLVLWRLADGKAMCGRNTFEQRRWRL